MTAPTTNVGQNYDPNVWPFLPPRTITSRLRHLSTSTYSIDQNTHIYRLVDAICGDAGAGTLKKELLYARFSQNLDTLYFHDLDDIFGRIFNLARLASESYSYDPVHQMLTTDQWDEVKIKDAWYRQRIRDFMAAIQKGGTPEGFLLMTRAALGVDAQLYEVSKYIDNVVIDDLIASGSFRMNLCKNPTCTVDTNGYAIRTPQNVAINSISRMLNRNNQGYLAFTTNASGNGAITLPQGQYIQSGLPYTASVQVLNSANCTVTVNIDWLDVNGNVITTSTGTITNLNSGTQSTYSCTANAPAGAQTMSPWLQFTGLGPSANGWVQFCLYEQSNQVGTYFDGDTLNCRWLGLRGETPSRNLVGIETYGRTGISLRNEVIIRPLLTSLTESQRYIVTNMVNRIKPRETVVTIDINGLAIHTLISIRSVAASSSYFEVQKKITGNVDISKLPFPWSGNQLVVATAQDLDPSNYWIKANQSNQAPTTAFNSTQESSVYYLYSDTGHTAIDSVSYQTLDTNGTIVTQNPYTQYTDNSSSWGPWTPWELADSPDNFPGGKFGLSPFVLPALNKQGISYNFPWTSQAQYVSHQTQVVLGQGGQASSTQYRLPIKSYTTSSSKTTYNPTLAVSTTVPVRESSVSTPWVSRPVSSPSTVGNTLFAGA